MSQEESSRRPPGVAITVRGQGAPIRRLNRFLGPQSTPADESGGEQDEGAPSNGGRTDPWPSPADGYEEPSARPAVEERRAPAKVRPERLSTQAEARTKSAAPLSVRSQSGPPQAEPVSHRPAPYSAPSVPRWGIRTVDRPGQNGSLPKDSPEHWVPKEVVDECTTALATIGGSTLTCVGVTSCLRDEGRSTIASAVAVVQRFAYGRRTMLVELDMEKPSLAARLGVQSGPGVAGILRGQASVEACLQPIHPDLVLLPAGHVTDTISHTRSLLPTSGLMREVEELCDVAVVDLPPLFSDGMGTHAASLCSTLVLVVRAGTTPMKHIRRAVVALGQPPPIILNRVPKVGPRWLDKMLGGGQ